MSVFIVLLMISRLFDEIGNWIILMLLRFVFSLLINRKF